jgi:hypothetical protein
VRLNLADEQFERVLFDDVQFESPARLGREHGLSLSRQRPMNNRLAIVRL